MELGPARVFFTDREGGVSEGPYAGNNLADHVGDSSDHVTANRRALASTVAATVPSVPSDPARWAWLRQVHGTRVVRGDDIVGVPPEADASVTTSRGVPLAVLTADCAPIALANDTAVAVVHAGWTGLGRGVVEVAVESLREAGSGAVRAALGPCIHASRYEFGSDLLEHLVDLLGPEVASRTAEGRPALDVPAGVRCALASVGVDDITDVDVCTASSSAHFSYRRDGVTGRQALIALLP